MVPEEDTDFSRVKLDNGFGWKSVAETSMECREKES
jgi:hypothetical protein